MTVQGSTQGLYTQITFPKYIYNNIGVYTKVDMIYQLSINNGYMIYIYSLLFHKQSN